MTKRMTRCAAALAMGAVGASLVLVPTVAGGQAGPTMTVTPLRADPGTTISIVVDDCTPVGDRFGVGIEGWLSDTPGGIELTEESPGRWTGSVVGNDDFVVRATCEGVELTASVDIDYPRMFATPLTVPPITDPDPPEGFLGTDCPDGTTAHVFFQAIGRPAPVHVTAAIDERGDWQVTAPPFPVGTQVEVSASCGTVSYPSRSYVAGGSGSVTSTTTSAPSVSSSTTTEPTREAAPAAALAGSPSFTG
jgi:hypothetical protein